METVIHTFFAANPAIKGAIVGLLTAVGVDLHAYATSDAGFNVKKALARYAYGIIMGLLGGGAL